MRKCLKKTSSIQWLPGRGGRQKIFAKGFCVTVVFDLQSSESEVERSIHLATETLLEEEGQN